MINIIGGAGFVGNKLSTILRDNGKQHCVYDKTLSGEAFIDVTDLSSFENMAHCTVIINLAAEHRDNVEPKSLYDAVNVDGAVNVCKYCEANDIKKIIFTSSVAVYGLGTDQADETTPTVPFNDYGRTKLLAEHVYIDWLNKSPTERTLIIIRPTVIFGEGNRGNVYNLFKQIHSGSFLIFGSGNNKKSMAYVENVARFIEHCDDNLESGLHVYNYADTPDLTMNELVKICRARFFMKPGTGLHLPSVIGLVVGYFFDVINKLLPRATSISSVRIKKFMANTTFATAAGTTSFVAPVTLKQGIERTLQYEFFDDEE